MDSQTSKGNLGEIIKISYGAMNDERAAITYLTQFVRPDLITNSLSGKFVPYDLEQFILAVDFATLYEGSISSQRIQEYTATLSTRLQTIRDGIQGKLLTKTSFSTVDEYINDLLGQNQIVDVDISTLDDASAEVVTKVLAKLILDYLKRQEKKANMPVNISNSYTCRSNSVSGKPSVGYRIQRIKLRLSI